MAILLAGILDTVMAIAMIVALFFIMPLIMLKAWKKGHLKTFWGAFSLLASILITTALVNHYLLYEGRSWDNAGSLGAVLVLVLVPLGLRWIREGGPGFEHLPPDFTCEEVDRSIEKARATLDVFCEEVKKKVDGAFIKFPLKTPNENTEHIWASVHSFKNGRFKVTLDNDPFDPDQKTDGRRDVEETDVEDWQILQPDGQIKGAYSLMALIQHFESRGKLTSRMREERARHLDYEETQRSPK